MSDSSEDDERPANILSVTPDDYRTILVKSNLFMGRIDAHRNDDVEFGIEVHQDGPDIALSAGTTWTAGEDDPEVYSYQALTVEQAREIAAALEEAADNAEEAATGADAVEREPESFLRRLLP